MLKADHKILLVDPEQGQLNALEDIFAREGFIVYTAHTGREAMDKAFRYHPHIILLEVMLPGSDGIELCHELRNSPATKNSIISFYTVRNEDYSQIAAFSAGADDYILKPAKANVLVTRARALLRRLGYRANGNNEAGTGLKIDRERYVVTIDGDDVTLPRKEFELLALLYSTPRKVFSRQEIARLIWGYEIQPRNRTIDVHIRKLRERLGDRLIKTVKGIGYSLEL